MCSKVALKWIPQGKPCRGRPETTWWRTLTTHLEDPGLAWAGAERIARDCKKWSNGKAEKDPMS